MGLAKQPEPSESYGLGKKVEAAPKPVEDVVIEVKPGVWSVNGKLRTAIHQTGPRRPPQKPIDWKAVADAMREMAEGVDIVILEDGILQIPRDPEFPREEWGTW